jgi:tetratricopeptide (TPR) repeat protein
MRFLPSSRGVVLLGLALLWALPLRGQDWRGTGRLTGFVQDQSGQPIADASVKLTRVGGSGPSPVKTNSKGYWAVQGLAGGGWNVDVSAPGYETRKQSAGVTEGNPRAPQLQTQLKKAAVASPAAPAAEVAQQKNSGAEVIAAVNEGNLLLGEKKFAEARAQYEKAISLLPENSAPALWKGIAQTYHGEGNTAKTIETLKKAAELDPNDTESRVLLASMLVQEGQLDEGKAFLDALPHGAVKDPAVYVNIAIMFMNKNKPEDAHACLTTAIEMDPAQAESYYYRGMASIQMKKKAEARADFRKYLELAPNGPQAKEAQEMLQAIK